MPQIIDYISQKFIKEAEEQLKKAKNLNPTGNLLEILNTFNKVEDYLKCALYTGDNNAYYKLAMLYDLMFEVLPKYKELNLPMQKLRDEMVLAGKKLGITECLETELTSNQIINDNNLNALIKVVEKVQKYFSNKHPETKNEIIELYYQTCDAISEQQHFNSTKKITGILLNRTDNNYDDSGNFFTSGYDGNDKQVQVELVTLAGDIEYNTVYNGS